GVVIGRVLKLNHRQRQAVDKHHYIRATVALAADNGKLVHHQKLVVVDRTKINQAGVIVLFFAVVAVFHLNPFQQILVEGVIGVNQHRAVGLGDLRQDRKSVV